QQFLSEAYSIWDCVIFATAPLGIITAIVTAIRISGPLWMCALIGRAREDLSSVELELMSSTSRDVGEIWNGETIVRSAGRLNVVQLILIRSESDDPPPKPKSDGSLDPQDDAEKAASEAPKIDVREFENAPNISLNLHSGSEWAILASAALIGTVLQLGVVVYSGSVTFHSGLRKLIPPYSDHVPHLAKMGFILLASGTVILTLALIVVCNVIETSTSEREWRVDNQLKEVRVMWLQRERYVGDQQFDAAILFAREDKHRVLTSQRSSGMKRRVKRSANIESIRHNIWRHVASNRTEWITLTSTTIAMVGFGLQFQGLRFLNWSCSLVQLAAIFAMTLIRATLRRGL
ncbi:hypothetical protein K491DRAFT_579085, partial [Lophiostoma macrostomum CBS 122681]